MSSVLLAQAKKLGVDQLVQGVIEEIVTVDAVYSLLPFQPIAGNALTYNRELTLGDVQNLAIDESITAKTQATYTQVTSTLTTILGDA